MSVTCERGCSFGDTDRELALEKVLRAARLWVENHSGETGCDFEKQQKLLKRIDRILDSDFDDEEAR